MFGIVIDRYGCKIEFVVLDKDENPQYYELKKDEQIIKKDYNIANSMVKPKWDGEKWVETGTPDPIPEAKPTEIEILKQEKETLAKSVYDLTEIIELLIKGGIK